MSLDFSECDKCGSTTRESEMRAGLCEPCYDLSHGEGETVEVPVSVLQRLVSSAESRHPTVCNQDAPRFRNVLTWYGYPVEREQ